MLLDRILVLMDFLARSGQEGAASLLQFAVEEDDELPLLAVVKWRPEQALGSAKESDHEGQVASARFRPPGVLDVHPAQRARRDSRRRPGPSAVADGEPPWDAGRPRSVDLECVRLGAGLEDPCRTTPVGSRWAGPLGGGVGPGLPAPAPVHEAHRGTLERPPRPCATRCLVRSCSARSPSAGPNGRARPSRERMPIRSSWAAPCGVRRCRRTRWPRQPYRR